MFAKPNLVPPSGTLFEHSESRLDISKFVLAGLGESGEDCQKVVMSHVDVGEDEDDIRAVRFKPLFCGRIECPHCYYEWAIRQTFDIVMKVETMALLRGERPFHVVFSIHPNDCRDMTWTDVNEKLWRRGVRRLQYKRCKIAREYGEHTIAKCPICDEDGDGRCKIHERGVNHKIEDCPDCFDLNPDQYGGIGIFHPLRIRDKYRSKWGIRADGEIDRKSGRYWRKIREKIEGGKNGLEKYAKIGFHAHNWTFTDKAEKQQNREYLIKYSRNFRRYSREEVVALTRYLVTHTATIREMAVYRGYTCENCGHTSSVSYHHCNRCGHFDTSREDHIVRNRIVHPIRSFGLLHDFNPKRALVEKYGYDVGRKKYRELAKAVADLLFLRKDGGEMLTMAWNDELETLEYPAYAKEDRTSKEKANWISIWELLDMVRYERFAYYLSPEKEEFVIDLLDYVENTGKPPPLEDCGRSEDAGLTIPDGIDIVAPIENARDEESDEQRRATVLREEILELLKRCDEESVFGMEIYFGDYSMGEILGVLGYMVERGEVIQDGANVSLPISKSQKSKQIVLRG